MYEKDEVPNVNNLHILPNQKGLDHMYISFHWGIPKEETIKAYGSEPYVRWKQLRQLKEAEMVTPWDPKPEHMRRSERPCAHRYWKVPMKMAQQHRWMYDCMKFYEEYMADVENNSG